MEFELDEARAKEAFDKLVKYLAVAPRSEKECKERLYQKGYHKDEVEFALAKAKKYRYIDDEAYVKIFLSQYTKKYGLKKIAYKLATEKGISKELIDRYVVDEGDSELEKCREFAEKYIQKKQIEGKAGAGKVSQYLYQRGFEYSVINKVISSLFDVYED